ncbi:Csu type fimbrial protein [Paraburkholderia acidisoli]|uniref:Fimbrial major subunit CsuA/B family protein n=1 Tax=Paraburkholderia acidisoli TaxID=2571748 RepID=A0A7Z2GS52_9BURK|nr:spore coat U domain-containing protein [Paraburkholderia acidisoli]QGZ66933.1 fimbrial major subunit CsuA/B family protein [Paraburkholderia acidisoli]
MGAFMGAFRRACVLAGVCLALLLAANSAHAETCSASASTVSFGNVSPISGAPVTATGSVSITCTWSAVTLTPSVLVCLNLGGTTPRTMSNGTNTLNYDLYQDGAYAQRWGSIYTGSTPISITLNKPTGTTLTQTVTFYGQIAGSQPTVPTVNNATTTYTQNFGADQTSLNYAFFLLLSPTCPSVTTIGGTFPFSVSANVINNCNISATPVAFGSRGVLQSAVQANGTITAQCTNGDAYRISLNGGSSGNVAARTMQRSGGGTTVSYQLYLDAALGSAWGDGTNGTVMATGTGTGTSQTFTVYGRVPAQSGPTPGSYSDTITATIAF